MPSAPPPTQNGALPVERETSHKPTHFFNAVSASSVRAAFRAIRGSLFALIVYFVLSCVATYPAIFRLSSELIGQGVGDSYEMLWLFWWLRRALFALHVSPLQIPLLFYPEGLYFPLLATQLGIQFMALPITVFASPVVAYNLAMLGSLALAGLTAYWLGLELTQNRPAAFVAGMVWAFFPNKMGHALGGHIYQVAVFLFPLYALTLVRLLKSPSWKRGLLVGVTGALAVTVHSIHIVYFLLPVTFVIVAMHWLGHPHPPTAFASPASGRGEGADEEEIPGVSSYWTRARLVGLAGAGLAGLAILLPLYWPLLQQYRQGELRFLAERGIVGFSTDLLAFIVPAPGNPIASRIPDLQELAERVTLSEYEHIAYLGLIPLLLAGLGIWRAWRKTRPWLALGLLTGTLSLGPLLKFGGSMVNVAIEGGRVQVLLPYALVMKLPFMAWSRTPARLNQTTSLALTVLVAYGAAWLFARIRRRWLTGGLATLLGGLIFVEYMVAWPFPTADLAAAEIYQSVVDQPGVILNVPATRNDVNLQALLGQTVHGQPMIGGRLLRDVPGKADLQTFLNRLLLSPGGADILEHPTAAQRLAALRAYDAGWVAYHAVGDDADGSARLALGALLGAPVSDGYGQALFPVPAGDSAPDSLITVLGGNWYTTEAWGAAPTRWFHDVGSLYVYSPVDQRAHLRLTLIPELELHVVAVKVNGTQVTEIAAGDWLPFVTPQFPLRAGVNVIELVDLRGSRTYVGDLRCAGGTPLSGPFAGVLDCDPSKTEARQITLGVQDLRVEPLPTEPASRPALATFDDNVHLLQAAWPESVQPGEALPLTVYWQADRWIETDWTAFVHVSDEDGAPLAGLDQEPMDGRAPTTGWAPGQVVAYTVHVPIALDAPPGSYRVRVGWYQWPSLERLPVASPELIAADRIVTLGVVEVAP